METDMSKEAQAFMLREMTSLQNAEKPLLLWNIQKILQQNKLNATHAMCSGVMTSIAAARYIEHLETENAQLRKTIDMLGDKP